MSAGRDFANRASTRAGGNARTVRHALSTSAALEGGGSAAGRIERGGAGAVDGAAGGALRSTLAPLTLAFPAVVPVS
eukprot:scaffold35472_cov31-Tisochrysis_lutea.AAC.2